MRLRKQTDGVAEVGATKELKADDLIAAKEPLAIIGMSCRLPGGSNSTEELWEMLAEGRSGWVQGAGDRFQSDAFYHPAAELGGVVRDSTSATSSCFGFLQLAVVRALLNHVSV